MKGRTATLTASRIDACYLMWQGMNFVTEHHGVKFSTPTSHLGVLVSKSRRGVRESHAQKN